MNRSETHTNVRSNENNMVCPAHGAKSASLLSHSCLVSFKLPVIALARLGPRCRHGAISPTRKLFFPSSLRQILILNLIDTPFTWGTSVRSVDPLLTESVQNWSPASPSILLLIFYLELETEISKHLPAIPLRFVPQPTTRPLEHHFVQTKQNPPP